MRVLPVLRLSQGRIGTTATNPNAVIAGLDPAIQPLNQQVKNWMPGSSPGKTWFHPTDFCPRLPGD